MLSVAELRSVIDDRLSAYKKSASGDWRVFEESETRTLELDERPLILLGAGALTAQDFVSYAVSNYRVVALVDNMRVGEVRFGERFIGDDEFLKIAHQEPKAIAVMCCAGDVAVPHFAALASALNIPVLSLFQARKRIGSVTYYDAAQGMPDVMENLANANPFIGSFKDEASLRAYYCVLLHRLSWSRHWLDMIRLPYNDMYFGTDVFSVSQNEIMIDAGAFDGDTIRAFDRFTNGQSRHIYAFEPDGHSASTLRKSVGHRDDVTIVEAGLWSETTSLSFRSDGSLGSGIRGEGTHIVPVVALDESGIEEVSLIKMDIETAEVPALKGGRNLISRCAPKLAICAYHLTSDFIEIPRAIVEIREDYQLFLRHHSPWLTDSVIYAMRP